MATAVKSQRMREPIDLASANFLAVFLGIVILVAFIFMPWMWTEMKYNGARLMSDVLTAPGRAGLCPDLGARPAGAGLLRRPVLRA